MPSRPPKKPGGKEADEGDTTTTMSRASAITFENTKYIPYITITYRLRNEKVPNIVKGHEVIEEVLIRDSKHQISKRKVNRDENSRC